MILETPILSRKKEEQAAAESSSSGVEDEVHRVLSPAPPKYSRKPKPKSVYSYDMRVSHSPTQAQKLANPDQPTKASIFASGVVITQQDGRVSKDEHKTGWVMQVGENQFGQTFSVRKM